MINVAAPILLNGIVNVVERPDLAERAIFINLETISEESRSSEKVIYSRFEAVKASLFGALLDGLVVGLRNEKNVTSAGYARMNDFARWATACESAYWPAGTFEAAYRGMATRIAEDLAEHDPVAEYLTAFLSDVGSYEGTASEVLMVLNDRFGDQVRDDKQWPRNPRALSEHLKRVQPVLHKLGVEIVPMARADRKGSRKKLFTMKNAEPASAKGPPCELATATTGRTSATGLPPTRRAKSETAAIKKSARKQVNNEPAVVKMAEPKLEQLSFFQ